MSWIAVPLLLVAVLTVAIVRERWRVRGIEAGALALGWSGRSSSSTNDVQPAASLVARMTLHGAQRWGMILDGTVDGVSATIAEHESSEPGRKQAVWHTVVTWPVGEPSGPIVVSRGRGSKALAQAAEAAISIVREPIINAIRGSAPPDNRQRIETPAGWVALGGPDDLARWLTPDKIRELDAWPHEGEFARGAGSAAWRVRGSLSAATLPRLVEQIAVARRLMQ
jgi:hypothetical protein